MHWMIKWLIVIGASLIFTVAFTFITFHFVPTLPLDFYRFMGLLFGAIACVIAVRWCEA